MVDRARCARDWPTQWPALLAAANQRPPMTLRVNARRGSGADYVQRLAAPGHAARLLGRPGPRRPGVRAGPAVPGARPARLRRGRGLGAGCAAQRAAGCCCSTACRRARGCSTPAPRRAARRAHLLELADLELLALDSEPLRLRRVHDTLQRLQLQAELKAGDARQPAAWWDGRPFDAILLDAPCSASGIVRRHPDVRWLRRATTSRRAGAHCRRELLEALVAAAGPRRPPAVCHLLGLPLRGPGADRRVFATPCRQRRHAWTRPLQATC